MLDPIADRLRPVTDGLNALQRGAKALVEGIVEFFRLLPTALASGAADTMAAHGRDPKAGLGLSLEFDAVDDWDEAWRSLRQMDSFLQASRGYPPSEPQHMGLYLMVTDWGNRPGP